MRYEYPEPDQPFDPAWIAPLLAVDEILAKSLRIADSFFDPDDFMIMGWYRRPRRSNIMLYKHRDTRRYLNVDGRGRAYRYVPPPNLESEDDGYRRHPTLRAAIDHIGLWELPWMRPDLEHHRRGYSFDERWELFHQLTADDPMQLQ